MWGIVVLLIILILFYENDKHEHFTCTAPTNNNPFMNFLPSDYQDNPCRSKACKESDIIDGKSVTEIIDNKFNNNYNNYYYDNDEIFMNHANQLPFYTMPVTNNPNNQKRFADWLYYVPDTCKTNQLYCAKYDDLIY